MKEQKLVTNIYHLVVVATIFNVIWLLVSIYMLTVSAYALITIVQVVITLYILVQIETACKTLRKGNVFSKGVTECIQKVAHACIVNGIATSMLQTLITSYYDNAISIHFSVTMIGVGILLYVGARIYQYGCEQKEEIDLTV